MNFTAFQLWRQECLVKYPDALDCAETNLYRALASIQPKADSPATHQVYRCDLARAWLRRLGLPESESRRTLVCRGVRHALSIIFRNIAGRNGVLWLPGDVYPVYIELARSAGIEPKVFTTLPAPVLPQARPVGGAEFLLVTNPWKPLGRFLTEAECATLLTWLEGAPQRRVLVDCVYDLGVPLHAATMRLMQTGRAIVLHSVTKGWLWPKTFGVAWLGEGEPQLEMDFRNDPPSREQLQLAEKLLLREATFPGQFIATLARRQQSLLTALPPVVVNSLLINSMGQTPGGYHFPVDIAVGELLGRHKIIGIPASAFGANWQRSVLTSLAAGFQAQTATSLSWNGGKETCVSG